MVDSDIACITGTSSSLDARGRPLNQCHIAIEGAIGIGKTTLAKKMADKLGCNRRLEQAHDNPFIEQFYQNPTHHALASQLAFLFSRLKQHQTIDTQETLASGLITDYLFAKDYIFSTITLTSDELTIYEQVAQLVTPQIQPPDLVIYLQSKPDIIMERIRRRNLPIEKNLTMSYLEKVITAYDNYFFHYKEAPLLIVQTDHMNFASQQATVDELIERIGTMSSQTEFWANYS
ncbi:MAG: deoxynucleoside kinase [Mariprofundus sp.]|nr:deoxynucleoside kinase [Mariprofundus sp.]